MQSLSNYNSSGIWIFNLPFFLLDFIDFFYITCTVKTVACDSFSTCLYQKYIVHEVYIDISGLNITLKRPRPVGRVHQHFTRPDLTFTTSDFIVQISLNLQTCLFSMQKKMLPFQRVFLDTAYFV